MNNAHDFELIVRSRFPLVAVESREEKRVFDLLAKFCIRNSWPLFSWSVTDGIQRCDGLKQRIPETKDPEEALRHIDGSPQNGVFVMFDFHPYLESPVNQRLIKDIAQDYVRTPRTLVFVSAKLDLPAELKRLCATFDIVVPNNDALLLLIQDEARRWQARNGEKVKAQREVLDTLAQHLGGLCEDDARRLVTQAIEDDGALSMEDLPRVLRAKYEMVGGELLELELDTAKFADIGGLKNLKRWLDQRRVAFIGEAPGLDPPKGILITGVQGGGKSLAAKAIAGAWNLPLLRFDFGKLFNKFIGETERNLREALHGAEAMAPCVLWLDEVEKGLAQESNDEGVSRRLLGTLLTWMAEKKAKVFIAMTANDISALPPELLRKGRIDEIFFVDLPDAETRTDVFGIHLRRRKLPEAQFDIAKLVTATGGYTGAEIEQAIVSALYDAHSRGEALATTHVLAEIERTRPLSVVMAERVAALRAWAVGRAVMAN